MQNCSSWPYLVIICVSIIQVQVLGETEILVSNVFTVKGCSPIPGAEVRSTNDEATMLANWAEFVRACDPDIITG